MKRFFKRMFLVCTFMVLLFSLAISSNAASVANTGYAWPIEVTSGIDLYRSYNLSFDTDTYEPVILPCASHPDEHAGIDISAPYGTTINSAINGTVVCASVESADNVRCSQCKFCGAGYHVLTKGSDGRYQMYAHMSSVSVTTGAEVTVGQKIGAVGSTGNSTGPHLHFAVYAPLADGAVNLNGDLDPMPLLTPFSTVYANEISATKATLHGVFGARGIPFSAAGIYMGTSPTAMNKITDPEAVGCYKFMQGYEELYFNTSAYYGTLSSGTTYYYQIWIEHNGKELKSDIYMFTAGDSSSSSKYNEPAQDPDSDQTSNQEMFNEIYADNITSTNATINAKIPYQFITDCGFNIGTSSSSMTKVYEKPSEIGSGANVEHIYFDLNDYGVTLTPTQYYYYNIFFVGNGTTYTSDTYSFYTGDLSVNTIPEGLEYTISDGEVTITKYSGSATDLEIPEYIEGYPVTAIGESAFVLYNITSISLPDTLKRIDTFAFAACINLNDITIPKNVTSIADGAFYNCGLNELKIDPANSAYKVLNGVLYTFDGFRLVAYPINKTDSFFTVPAEVTHISDYAFPLTYNLKDIYVEADNTAYIASNGVLYTFDKTELILYPAGKEDISFTIPDTVTKIHQYAFYDSKAQFVFIPQSVTTVLEGAFVSSSNLTIYAEASSKPEGWHTQWNFDNRPVVWGYAAATGITLDKDSVTLTSVGSTAQLTATVAPTDATNKAVTWTSSNDAVATVDQSGKVTAVANGTCTITVTTQDGGFTDTCAVTVNIPQAPAVDPTAPTLTVNTVEARPGETVTVTMDISNNPGFAYIWLNLVYDSTYLTLTATENNIAELGFTLDHNMIWDNDKNFTANGTLVTFTFTVSDNAPEGTYPISVTCGESYNEELDDISWSIAAGGIEVNNTVYGDANDDGIVNGKDLILLRKYLAGYNSATGESNQAVSKGADNNGDGIINGKDLIMLRKYLAAYNSATGSSTVVLGPQN